VDDAGGSRRALPRAQQLRAGAGQQEQHQEGDVADGQVGQELAGQRHPPLDHGHGGAQHEGHDRGHGDAVDAQGAAEDEPEQARERTHRDAVQHPSDPPVGQAGDGGQDERHQRRDEGDDQGERHDLLAPVPSGHEEGRVAPEQVEHGLGDGHAGQAEQDGGVDDQGAPPAFARRHSLRWSLRRHALHGLDHGPPFNHGPLA
jgi:hypothetical protein